MIGDTKLVSAPENPLSSARPSDDARSVGKNLYTLREYKSIARIAQKRQSRRTTGEAAADGSDGRSKSMGGNTPTTAMPTGASAGRRVSTAVRHSNPDTVRIKTIARYVKGSICGTRDIGQSASAPRIHASRWAMTLGKMESADARYVI